MKKWNAPGLVELNTKFTADGGDGVGEDKVTKTVEHPNGNVTTSTTFSTWKGDPST
ncbi:MAG: hypothetical protein JEZ08_17910 [Clostridiales bacterium]|nr:hypothetical protein [Clostridiales bacterium]